MAGAADPFDLARFVDAQQGVFEAALAELRAGRKRGHWMWFIFPQLAGLGQSEMSRRYAVRSLAEARAYLAHPLLGPCLRDCTDAMLALAGRSAEAVFGHPDVLKYRSSLTLFARATADNAVFLHALDKDFAGAEDPATAALLLKTDS